MGDDYELKPHEPLKPQASPPPPAETSHPLESSAKSVAGREEKSDADIGNHRAMAMLAYIPVLVIIPLVFGQQSRFVRYHTNQGFLLFILEALRWGIMQVLYSALMSALPYHPIPALYGLVNSAISFVFLALAIVGGLHVISGHCEELPGIGKYQVMEIDSDE
jgi:uncharacterized membrane protein